MYLYYIINTNTYSSQFRVELKNVNNSIIIAVTLSICTLKSLSDQFKKNAKYTSTSTPLIKRPTHYQVLLQHLNTSGNSVLRCLYCI